MQPGVVILTYGESAAHLALLESLWAEGLRPADLVVVHNPARPGEPDPELPAGVELVRAAANRGYTGGMNLGIEAWRRRGWDREVLLLLTHDARLRPGALGRLLAVAAANPDYGVLGPALLLAGTEQPFSYGGVSGPGGATSHRKSRPADGVLAACDWIDGGTMLVRAAVLERLGGFDERLWSYCEDSDLCLRARRAGFGVGVALEAIADQSPGGAQRLGAWSYLLTRNGVAYARRAAGWRGLLGAGGGALRRLAVSLVRVVLRGLRLRRGSPREPWLLAVGTGRGLLDYLRGRWGPPPSGLPGSGDIGNAS